MRSRGFTLTEVLIGVVILGVVFLVGGQYFVYGAEFIEKAARKDRALQIAAGELEIMKGAPFSEITDFTRQDTIAGWTYSVEASVTDVTGAETYKIARVQVSWDENQELELTTIYANR